jgi:hypothetical protein
LDSSAKEPDEVEPNVIMDERDGAEVIIVQYNMCKNARNLAFYINNKCLWNKIMLVVYRMWNLKNLKFPQKKKNQ